jgi:hypothetical protein
MLNPRAQLSRPIPDKWQGQLPVIFCPYWCEIWHKHRSQMEAGFLWSVYHDSRSYGGQHLEKIDKCSDSLSLPQLSGWHGRNHVILLPPLFQDSHGLAF